MVSRRTTQYRWMWENRQWFEEQLEAARPPNWDKIASDMAALGLTNKAGEAPTRSGTRQTWLRVKKDWDASKERAVVRPSAIDFSAPDKPQPPLVEPIQAAEEEPFKFRQARLPPLRGEE